MHRGAPRRLFKEYGNPNGPLLQRLGSEYGRWFVPATIPSEWVVYSLGMGQDVSFDQAMIGQFGVTIYGFDPTPTAVAFVTERRSVPPLLTDHFKFTPVDMWDNDTTLRFFEPKTRGWVGSYSALNLQGTDDFIEVPCRSLFTLMLERGHNHIDLLKMDIEGAEYRVINHALDNAIPIHWLCVEFHQPVPLPTTREMITRLINHGFMLRHVDLWNFTFENCRYAS
jgi:FkbM family methyltransferase